MSQLPVLKPEADPPKRAGLMLLRFFCGVLLLFVLTGCLAERKGGVFAEYTSPAGTYKIRLSGRPQPVPGGMVGWGVHIIRAEVHKGSTLVIPAREIHNSDSMDNGFNEDYCSAQWTFENVLRFQSCYPLPGAPHRTADTMVLRNTAPQMIAFVEISTNTDMVLFLDVPAKSEIRVPIPGRTDANWYGVRGIWADRQELPTASADFFEPPSSGSEFTVIVESKRVEVVRRNSPRN